MSETFGLSSVPERAALESWRAYATDLAKSPLLPKPFHGNPVNVGLAIQYAAQMQLPVLTVVNAMYQPRPGGNLGFATEFMVGRLIESGRVLGTIKYETVLLTDDPIGGQKMLPDLKVTASVVDRESGETASSSISMRQAWAEGWAKRNSKYESSPEGMLRKRAATLLIRDHYPNVLQGARTLDEMEDIQFAEEASQTAARASALDMVNVAPSARPVEVSPVAELTPVQQDAAEAGPKPKMATAEQHNALLDWLVSEHVAPGEVRRYIKDAYGAKDVEMLNAEQAAETLDMIERGDFAPLAD
jgi:hypothetical protein